MKRILKYFPIILALLLIQSCGKEFLDVNTDPNNASDATPELVLPAAVMSAAGQFGSYYQILGGMWSQHWTQNNGSNQYKNIDGFNVLPTTLNTNFSELYSGALNDLKFVITKANESENWSFVLMATIMEAYIYQYLVDVYDQVPFEEALLGNEGNFTPHYNTGQEIYDGIITRINDAMALDLSASTSKNPGEADYIFGGDMDLWIQFANTLKLRIFLRQVYARPDVTQAGIQALYSDGGDFLSQDAAITQFIDEQGKDNPLYECDQRQLNTNTNIKASTTFMSWLIQNADPRIDYLFLPGADGTFKSLDQGNFNLPSTVSPPTATSRALINATDPVYFISEAESYFLQAEAVLRGYGTGDVKGLYDAGVMAAFAKYGLDGTAFVDAGGAYEYPASGTMEEQLEAIIVQKWASMAGSQGLESFEEHNRTGYPKYSPVPASDIAYEPGEFTYPIEGVTGNGNWAKRLLFPDTERSRNPNTPAQVPITTKVWWDQK